MPGASSYVQWSGQFLASEQWYAHHGIPYRRGYLLYGPPGEAAPMHDCHLTLPAVLALSCIATLLWGTRIPQPAKFV
jgi:hypothetical protein